MIQRPNNYDIQAAQAKKLFLTYDQQEIIQRCRPEFDKAYFYIRFLGDNYRICRRTGDMEKQKGKSWEDANSFGEIMTILDWLCDSRADRFVSGRWVNIVTQNHAIHRDLQEEGEDPLAAQFDKDPEGFSNACLALGGVRQPGADRSYAVELIDDLKILVQLWHGDEEFAPRLRFLWDENATRYIRYETTWYAASLLRQRLLEQLQQ